MALFGWAIFGAVLGVAGSEMLRKAKPELVKKVEDAAKRLTDSLSSSKSEKNKADDEAGSK